MDRAAAVGATSTAHAIEEALDREIGFVGAAAIGVGTMIAAGIVGRTADHGLTIIGATREGLLRRIPFGAIPEAAGQRAQNTVITIKRDVGITSRLAWLFDRNGNDQL